MTQSRSKSKRLFGAHSSHYFYNNESWPNPPTHSELHYANVHDVTSDVTFGPNYPDWRDRIKRGACATTTLDGTVYRVLSAKEGYYEAYWKMVPDGPTPGPWYEIRKDQGIGYLGVIQSIFPTISFGDYGVATATNRALARYNEKVAAVNRQFQGGVFFGEIAEALHGIRHPAEALFKGIEKYSTAATKLRRSYVKSKADFLSKSKSQRRQVAKAFTQAATGLWLERSFHWLPLMGDIRGAISALEHTFDRLPYTNVKASADDVQKIRYESGTYGGPIQYTGLYSLTDKFGASVYFHGKVRVGPRATWVPDRKALGFDLASFVPTLWELIPYSWAVDYFTNIGDIIYGASQGGTDVVWTEIGTKVYGKRSQIGAIGARPPVPSIGWHFTQLYGYVIPSEVTAEVAKVSRAIYNGTYIPTLDYKVPGLSLKWLNLGAAFLQRSAAFL